MPTDSEPGNHGRLQHLSYLREESRALYFTYLSPYFTLTAVIQKQKSLRLQNSSQAVKTVGKQFPLTSFQHAVCNSDWETVMLLEHMKQNCIKGI